MKEAANNNKEVKENNTSPDVDSSDTMWIIADGDDKYVETIPLPSETVKEKWHIINRNGLSVRFKEKGSDLDSLIDNGDVNYTFDSKEDADEHLKMIENLVENYTEAERQRAILSDFPLRVVKCRNLDYQDPIEEGKKCVILDCDGNPECSTKCWMPYPVFGKKGELPNIYDSIELVSEKIKYVNNSVAKDYPHAIQGHLPLSIIPYEDYKEMYNI